MERRRSDRARHQVKVSWRGSGAIGDGTTWDLCRHGAFINSPETAPLNGIVDFEIDPGDGREAMHCRGQVVWVNQGQLESYPAGFGIEFMDDDEQVKRFLISIATGDLDLY
jgi:hypothetical protein